MVLISAQSSCTTFYGLEPDPVTTTASSSSGTGGSEEKDLGFLPIADAAHLCSLVATCPTLGDSIVASVGIPVVSVTQDDNRNYSSCVDWLTLPLASDEDTGAPRRGFHEAQAMLVCMTASTTCDGASECVFVEALGNGDARCQSGMTESCSDHQAVDCQKKLASHCGTAAFPPGSDCAVGNDQTTQCSVGNCSNGDVTCDPTSDPGPDAASYLFSCGSNGLRSGIDCAASGLVCNGGSSSPTCVGIAGPSPCAVLGAQSCLGDRVEVCNGSVAAEVDCSIISHTCGSNGGGDTWCKNDKSECTPFDSTVNVCTGSVIALCLDGAITSLDCASIGESCVKASGLSTAHCE